MAIHRVRRSDGRMPVHRAMTLVELLVVVSIIVLLAAVSVPLLKPALEEGRVREGARQLSAYVAMVKSRAVQLGRPAGIWIERSEPGSNVASGLYVAEMPEPYSGDTLGATVAFRFDNSNYNPGRWVALGQPGAPLSDRSNGFFASDILTYNPANYSALVGAGETFLIRFNYRGSVFLCTRDQNATNRFVMPLGFVPPSGANGNGNDGVPNTIDDEPGVPFQIFRNPERSIGRQLQFASGVVIDLEFSGMGLDFPGAAPTQANRFLERLGGPLSLSADRGLEFAALDKNDDSPVVIMFNPSGTIERVVLQGRTYAPSGRIHLLVGELNGLERDLADNTLKTLRAEGLTNAPNPISWSAADTKAKVPYSQNLANRSNIWISLGHRTGAVTTAENAWELMPPGPWSGDQPYLADSLRAAREYGQAGSTMGGR